MLLLRLSNPNFYLLDEPTNHLDIEGQEALEAELLAQGATCLLVSHDRDFVRAVGNRFWQIEQAPLVEVDSPEPFFAAELLRGDLRSAPAMAWHLARRWPFTYRACPCMPRILNRPETTPCKAAPTST